jgi:hypothetical protein
VSVQLVGQDATTEMNGSSTGLQNLTVCRQIPPDSSI